MTLKFGDYREVATADEYAFPFVPPRIPDDDAFWEFCQSNPDLIIERDADGRVRIMPPTGFETSNRNASIIAELYLWNHQNGQPGYVTESSGRFRLPNGAERAPDAAWTRRERVDALTAEQRTRFLSLCPDFVIELLSPTDSLRETQEKMAEYIENGAALGWLIDRKSRTVYVYRPGRDVEVLADPDFVAADPELAGFSLSLARIF
jgi:Uma2 family endonuclease